MSMRIEDLKIFVDVVRHHSMNIAAEKNYTTPQNLSKIIKRMEEELGVVLFNRSKKGSDLTDEGEQFYLHIIEVLRHYEEAVASISSHGNIRLSNSIQDQTKKISVLCTIGALSYAVMSTYNKMLKQYNNLILEDEEINATDIDGILEHINSGKYDILACYVPQETISKLTKMIPEYILIHVIFDEMVLVVSKDNPLSRRGMISSLEISNLNLINFKNFKLAKNAFGSNTRYQLQTNSQVKALEQIKRSDSACALFFKGFCDINQEDFSKDGALKMIRLDKKVFGTYLIALHKDNLNNPCAMDFIKMLEELFKGTAEGSLD